MLGYWNSSGTLALVPLKPVNPAICITFARPKPSTGSWLIAPRASRRLRENPSASSGRIPGATDSAASPSWDCCAFAEPSATYAVSSVWDSRVSCAAPWSPPSPLAPAWPWVAKTPTIKTAANTAAAIASERLRANQPLPPITAPPPLMNAPLWATEVVPALCRAPP